MPSQHPEIQGHLAGMSSLLLFPNSQQGQPIKFKSPSNMIQCLPFIYDSKCPPLKFQTAPPVANTIPPNITLEKEPCVFVNPKMYSQRHLQLLQSPRTLPGTCTSRCGQPHPGAGARQGQERPAQVAQAVRVAQTQSRAACPRLWW